MDLHANLRQQAEYVADLAGHLSSLYAFACYHEVRPSTWDTCGSASLAATYRAERAWTRHELRELRRAMAEYRRNR